MKKAIFSKLVFTDVSVGLYLIVILEQKSGTAISGKFCTCSLSQ